MHYDTGSYSDNYKEKIAVDEAVFWVQDELKRIKNSFVENIYS